MMKNWIIEYLKVKPIEIDLYEPIQLVYGLHTASARIFGATQTRSIARKMFEQYILILAVERAIRNDYNLITDLVS